MENLSAGEHFHVLHTRYTLCSVYLNYKKHCSCLRFCTTPAHTTYNVSSSTDTNGMCMFSLLMFFDTVCGNCLTILLYEAFFSCVFLKIGKIETRRRIVQWKGVFARYHCRACIFDGRRKMRFCRRSFLKLCYVRFSRLRILDFS